MPILKTLRAPNGVTVSYHRLGQVEGNFPDLTVQVKSWIDRGTFLQGLPPSYAHYAPFDAIALLGSLEQVALGLEALAGGAIEADVDIDLSGAKLRRWARIKQTREIVMYRGVEFDGGLYDNDQKSIQNVMGKIKAMELAGATETASETWILADNTTRTLSYADLCALGLAMDAYASACYLTGAQLRAQIEAAETVEQVEAIVWPSVWPPAAQ